MTTKNRQPRIGFIGQGFIGKNMADDFERRGLAIVRYALEVPYHENKDAIADCDIVFIAIPTPTTPKGFDDTGLRSVLPLVGKGKVAVIKSTILPGKTEEYQALFPDILVMHSPEFLREKHAKDDTTNPARNIIGIPKKTKKYKDAANRVLAVLPRAPYSKVCHSREAELVKYAGNCFLATKVVFMNLMYNVAKEVGADYETVIEAMMADERVGTSHMRVVDSSGHHGAKKGRGAGGHCFPKDFAALRELHRKRLKDDTYGAELMKAIEEMNNHLLVSTGKDLELLTAIVGEKKISSY
jgi:nucleotide sugar dehydrogenase